MIEFACHQCKTRLKVKATAAGQAVACPRCQASLTVPGVKPTPAVPPLAKPLVRHPLGDPPAGESGDPTQRITELTAQNRELQEKLRRKETELELARLKMADLAKAAVGETKPLVDAEIAGASPSVATSDPSVVTAIPGPARSGWGFRLILIVLVAIIALLAWHLGRRSRPMPLKESTGRDVPVTVAPTVAPIPAAVSEPVSAPPPPVPSPVVVVPPAEPVPVAAPTPVEATPVAPTSVEATPMAVPVPEAGSAPSNAIP